MDGTELDKTPVINGVDIKPKAIPFRCPVCNGFGSLKYGSIKCQACEGKGYIVVDQDGQREQNEND